MIDLGIASGGSMMGRGLSQIGDLHLGHTLGRILRRCTCGSQ